MGRSMQRHHREKNAMVTVTNGMSVKVVRRLGELRNIEVIVGMGE